MRARASAYLSMVWRARPSRPAKGVVGERFIEVALGDGEEADEVAGAGVGDAAGELEADDGIEEGLDAGALGEVDHGVEGEGIAAGAGGDGALGAAAAVLALLLAVGGVVVDAEAGLAAGGEGAHEVVGHDEVAGFGWLVGHGVALLGAAPGRGGSRWVRQCVVQWATQRAGREGPWWGRQWVVR